MSGARTSQNPSPSPGACFSPLTYATRVDYADSDPLLRSGGVQETVKMSLCRMCGGPVDFPDAHKDCVLCLGRAHAEAALEGSDCQACEELPIKILRARLAVVRSGSLPAPASPLPAAFEPRAGRLQVPPSGGSNEGLTSAQRPRRPRTPEPPLIYVEESSRPPTKARELVSFGCEEDDTMSTNASDPDAWSEVPSEASCTPTSLDAELMNILTEAVADLELDWATPEQPSKRWMDGSFLGASRQADVPQRPAPFFPELHEELTRSWRSPHSARAHAQGTQLLTTVEGAEKKGYARPPPVEDAVAAHLCPSRGWKTASLPSKPCRATAHITEKAYISAGHAASALHTMAVLQVFQTRLLRSLDEEGPDPESFRKLRTAADLSLAASKKVAQGIGRSMGSLVVLHRHLWLTLTEMRDAEKKQLLDAPVSPQGLFGVAVEAFSEKYTEALKQSKMLPHLLPKRCMKYQTCRSQNERFRGNNGDSPERLDQTAGSSSSPPAHADGVSHHPAVLLDIHGSDRDWMRLWPLWLLYDRDQKQSLGRLKHGLHNKEEDGSRPQWAKIKFGGD